MKTVEPALGYQIMESDGTGVAVAGESSIPTLLFLQSSDPKEGKNRIHFDLCPIEGTSQADEVARLETLGARRADIGQEEGPWVVMEDPDGNEFCVMDVVPPPEPGVSDSSTMTAFEAGDQAWIQRFRRLRNLVRQELIARQLATTAGPPGSVLDVGCGQGEQAVRLWQGGGR